MASSSISSSEELDRIEAGAVFWARADFLGPGRVGVERVGLEGEDFLRGEDEILTGGGGLASSSSSDESSIEATKIKIL